MEEFHIFLRGLVDSDPEVVASLTHVATLVVNNGSGMHSTGFAGLPAPCAAFPTITGRKWPRSSSFSAVACSGGDWLGLLVTMHFALCSLACRPFWVDEGVAALVVVSGSGLRFPGFAGLTSRYVHDVCRQEVAVLVVDYGSGMLFLVLLVFVHLYCVPDDCRQALLVQTCDVEQIVASSHRSWRKTCVSSGGPALGQGRSLSLLCNDRCLGFD